MTTLIDKAKIEVKADEGWDAFPYKDHLGYDTIGYGFLIDRAKGGGLPVEVAEFWLELIITKRIKGLTLGWPPFVKQPEDVQLALLNMSYQMGVSGVLAFRKMLAALERGDRAEAERQALDSTWAKQTPKRATRVAAWIGGK